MSYQEKNGQVIRWEKLRPKEYVIHNPRPQYFAEVFGSPRGYSWAWSVWHETGVDSGVEITFRGAKHRAEEVIEKLRGAR